MTVVAAPIARTLERQVPFRASTTDGSGDGRTLEGYAAVFGQTTRIDSWEGTFDETIRAGAFRKTIRERTPVMQFDHGRHPLIGSIPIGSITDLREDEHGLFIAGRISDNWLMQPIRDAIAEGSVNGMSFRFEVVRQEWTDKAGKRITDPDELMRLLYDPGDRGPLLRTLIELRAPEMGPVVFPAYAGTQVSVRAREAAAGFLADRDAVRSLQAGLAADVADTYDDETRYEVARVLLFGERGAPDPKPVARLKFIAEIEPDPLDIGDRERPLPDPVATEPTTAPTETREDAPLDTEHPSPQTDAPPMGHPSSPDARKQYARQNYVTLNGVGQDY